MTLIVDNSQCPGRIEVNWSSALPAYLIHPRDSAYIVTAAVADVTRHGSDDSFDEFDNREWIAFIRDGSVTALQLDTESL